jgi:hypothetical protein
MTKSEDYAGVFQFFYHCKGEELPIRDILNTQHHGHKKEPHYENLTENWCRPCMEARIKAANANQVDYIFLVTRYHNRRHEDLDGKLLVVGYMRREEKPEVWERLNPGRRRGARKYDRKCPKRCGFFVGNEESSRFVTAGHAYVLKEQPVSGRWIKWYCDTKEANKIINHLKRHGNVLRELKKLAKRLNRKTGLSDSGECERKRRTNETWKK